MRGPRDYLIIDDEQDPGDGRDGENAFEDDAQLRDRRRRSLRAGREVLRRVDLRRTRTHSWVACLALLGAAVKLASLAWRGWRTGNAATVLVFGGLFAAAVVAAALLARRARAAGAALDLR